MADVLLTDIDGTLVDSNALHAEAWRRAFEHFGIEVGFDEAWRQIGKGGDKVTALFIPPSELARLEKPLKEWRKDIFHQVYMARIVAFPRAGELLRRVRSIGMTVVLATSANKQDLPFYGKLVGMEDLVDEAASGEDAENSKPDPDIFAAALKKVQMTPEKAVALGDTPWDAEAAGKLGIPTIGLSSGGWKAADLKSAGCVEVWKDPADLLDHFGDSLLGRARSDQRTGRTVSTVFNPFFSKWRIRKERFPYFSDGEQFADLKSEIDILRASTSYGENTC